MMSIGAWQLRRTPELVCCMYDNGVRIALIVVAPVRPRLSFDPRVRVSAAAPGALFLRFADRTLSNASVVTDERVSTRLVVGRG